MFLSEKLLIAGFLNLLVWADWTSVPLKITLWIIYLNIEPANHFKNQYLIDFF